MPISGQLKIGATLVIVYGEEDDEVDDFELKDLRLTYCGVGEPALPDRWARRSRRKRAGAHLDAGRAGDPAGDVLLQQKAVARAITQIGYIDPSAMLPGVFDQDDFCHLIHHGQQLGCRQPGYLPRTHIHAAAQGTWSVKAKGGITGRAVHQ